MAVNFKDLPNTETPINATNLNKIQNDILEVLGLDADSWSSSDTYSINEIVIYGNRLYKNKTGTNTSTSPNSDSTNWEETSVFVS